MIVEKLKGLLGGVKGMWNKFGIFLIVAIVIWLSPSWLAFFIPALRPFALTWLGLVVSPAVPSWAAIPLLAIVSKLVFIGIKRLVGWTKDQLTKLKYGAEIFTLYTVDEIELILKNGHKMKKIKDKETAVFKTNQRDNRIKLIKENWETTIEETEKENK